jgi:hypothetical protein
MGRSRMNISSRVFGVAIALATISFIPVFADEAGVARDKMIRALYRGVQDMGNGAKAEAYKVEFELGTMMWVASLDSTGKLLVLWSNGQVRPK